MYLLSIERPCSIGYMKPEDIAADAADDMLRRLMNEHMTVNQQRQVVAKNKTTVGNSTGVHLHQGASSIYPWKMPSISTTTSSQPWNYPTTSTLTYTGTKQDARKTSIDVGSFLQANQNYFTKATLEEKSGTTLTEITLTTNIFLFKEFLKANNLTQVITDEAQEILQDQATELELSDDVKKGMALAAAFFAKLGQAHLSELI